MRLPLTERILADHAFRTLGSPGRLAPRAGRLFDPSRPLPLPGPPPRGFPSFRDLFATLPQPYAGAVYRAHAQMSGFACAGWPLVSGLVDAQPFFEWQMHTDLFKPWYRDHIVHQVRVAAIGDLLLDQRVGGRTILSRAVEAIAQRPTRPRLGDVTSHSEDFVRLAWWLGALFHDSMYQYEYHEGQYRNLQTVCQLPLANPTQTSWFQAHNALAGLVRHLTRQDLLRCQEAHHQFAGAAELAMQNEFYEQGIGSRESAEYRDRRRMLFGLACEAILGHHKLRVPSEPIRFSECPLGYLLVLSDELHEADRPHATTTVPSGTRKTVTRFGRGEIKQVTLGTGRAARPRLAIEYICRPGVTHVRGLSKPDWEAGKQQKMKSEMLAFGDRELFTDLTVRAV